MQVHYGIERVQGGAWLRRRRRPADNGSDAAGTATNKKKIAARKVQAITIVELMPRNAQTTAHIVAAMRETTSERGRKEPNNRQHGASADLNPLAQEHKPSNHKIVTVTVPIHCGQQRLAHLKRISRNSLSSVHSSSISSTRCRAGCGVCDAGHGVQRAKSRSPRSVGGLVQWGLCSATENVG